MFAGPPSVDSSSVTSGAQGWGVQLSQSQLNQLEDMSSLGGDWNEQDAQSQATAEQPGAILESHLEEQALYYEKNAMIVDGYKCPDEYLNILTPMEFEEMVNLFVKFDSNKSGTIDKHEAKKILNFLGLDFSMDKAEELLRIVDTDHSGEIDFNEFCGFIVMIKRGDERLTGFASLLDKLNSTPLGELERQAKYRDMKLAFEIIEQLEATLFNPTLFVVEVRLSGLWHKIDNGEIKSEFCVRKYQGMGNNTREAKYAAATAALVNMGDSMPGMKYKPGEFPDEWLDWVDENLLRGVEPGRIVSILASKGFHPHKNNRLMHRILTWHSLLAFSQDHPEIDLHDLGASLPDDFVEWIKLTARKGIDGEVIYQLLKDRYIDLEIENVAFCQQLRNNEVGSLFSRNEEHAFILDFWHACRSGYLDDVRLYCQCGVAVNEEVLDRYTTERMTALGYAASYGHANVISVLIEYHVDLHVRDRRGRNAVHLAAMRGHVEACRVLIEHGGELFAGDYQGNSPLHLAALHGHAAVVDYLAEVGQALTRSVTSDQVRAVAGKTFLQVAQQVFEELPKRLLAISETVRFEKKWLHEAAVYLVSLVDAPVRYRLPRSCMEIMHDVLARFDPRPETGIFVTEAVSGDPVFIKCVASAEDLAVLLNYTYRQAAIDSINNFHRTAFHLACDANIVQSHATIILRLLDDFGCNVKLKDRHGRQAIDLLVQDKVTRDGPSSTEARERVLIGRRESGLQELFANFDAIDREREAQRRQAILDECILRGRQLEERQWHCLREASLFRKRFSPSLWEMYEDPDTGNLYYTCAPEKRLIDNQYREYAWDVPEAAKTCADYSFAVDYLRHIASVLLRRFGDWEVYRMKPSIMSSRQDEGPGGVDVFYHTTTTALSFTPPACMDWIVVCKEAQRTGERLGYASEWEVWKDIHGNVFYRNRMSKECLYDRPLDAIVITPAEMLCTRVQWKDKVLDQKWYSCEQCNRAWKTNAAEMLMAKGSSDAGNGSSGGGNSVTRSLVVCEPCITRCHAGHKGVRFLMQAPSSRTLSCMCAEVSRMTQLMCRACTISETQRKTQALAEKQRLELQRQAQRNAQFPLLLALVPRVARRGEIKTVSGWHVCRLCPSDKTAVGEDNGGEAAAEEGGKGGGGGRRKIGGQEDEETESDGTDTDSNSEGEDEEEEEVEQKKMTKSSKKELQISTSIPLLENGNNPSPPSPSRSQAVVSPASQGTWVEVYDVEEPETLSPGDLVLCTRYEGPPRVEGRIRSIHRPGFYRVRYEDKTLPEEILERSYLELLSRPKFYFHTGRQVSSWSRDQWNDPISSQSLSLTGDDWTKLADEANLRRAFDEWDELHHPLLDQLIYCHHERSQEEKAALRLQRLYRQRFHRAKPCRGWKSVAFTFDMPATVRLHTEILSGWAYLRRRSRNVGEFLDANGDEWEEYADSKTAEYFYWSEEDNRYQWDKPTLYVRNTAPEAAFKEGQEVLFKFPGRRNDEAALITKVRFDDQNGEDMYDLVHKYNPDLHLKWIPRMRIRNPMMEGDALMLAKLETKWKQVIRRRREADERKAQRDRELRLAKELEQLEAMKTLAYKLQGKEEAVSTTTRLMRGRMERIALDRTCVREELDRLEGKARRDRVYALVTDLKAQYGSKMTRAEELKLLRSLDLKMQMEDRIVKRNALQKELLQKKAEVRERIVFVERTLQEKEVIMTTPRSLRRRKLIRRCHIAMKRQSDGLMICEWGCGDWFRIGHEQQDHQQHRCVKRILPCALGCTLKLPEEEWLAPFRPPAPPSDAQALVPLGAPSPIPPPSSSSRPRSQGGNGLAVPTGTRSTLHTLHDDEAAVLGEVTFQQHHETEDCIKRLVICPLQCLEWIPFEMLDKHVRELCVKRPAEPLVCRLGCEEKFGGTVEGLIQAEDDRNEHETEECVFRMVRCNWLFEDGKVCAAQMRACDRAEHRDFHLHALGVITYTVPGVYTYRIPKKLTRLKVQIWGAGGGSGYFHGRQGGDGGGGAYVEAIIDVEPFSILEVTVGSGGGAGVPGSEIKAMDLDAQRALAAERRTLELSMPVGTKLPPDERMQAQTTSSACGVAEGGTPGGGQGYAGGQSWASGGGGGYSSLCRRTARGTVVFLVAGGGGGGASQDGRPGGGLDGELAGTRLDPINGGTATVSSPGHAGETGSTFNSQWPASPGNQWMGGNGCEFGGGGGGGYFGGGGGGTSPGISGGGGGGSSYINPGIVRDYVIILGNGVQPGGLQHNPPEACGVGEWDRVGGLAGQGGRSQPTLTFAGNNGAVRISKPGHY